MGKCLSKQLNDKVESVRHESIEIALPAAVCVPIRPPYLSSRLIDVVCDKTLYDYRVSLSPTHASSNDMSTRSRVSLAHKDSVHSFRKLADSSSSSSTRSIPMGKSPQSNIRLHIDVPKPPYLDIIS